MFEDTMASISKELYSNNIVIKEVLNTQHHLKNLLINFMTQETKGVVTPSVAINISASASTVHRVPINHPNPSKPRNAGIVLEPLAEVAIPCTPTPPTLLVGLESTWMTADTKRFGHSSS